MAFVCENCKNTDYDELDGFYYCSECGVQSQLMRLFEADDGFKGRVFKTKETKVENDKIVLTSWEEYNIVIAGVVDELVELGASDTFKLTALQLWAALLREKEVAFFNINKVKVELPKLSIGFQWKDAQIIYKKTVNRTRKRKAASRSSASESCSQNSVASSKSIRRSAKSRLLKSHNTSLSKSFCSSSSSKSIPLFFTNKARKLLKTKIPKKHIKKHAIADDLNDLKCHKVRKRDFSKNIRFDTINIIKIICIIYIALLLSNSEIHLGDLIRFFREDHLSLYNLKKFFPENYKSTILTNMRLRPISPRLHYLIRNHSARELFTSSLNLSKISITRKNFHNLCERIIVDYCLPPEIKIYVERLIELSPPNFKMKNSSELIANYEGRAFAYILFVMKLIFGLDDRTEILLSESAKVINSKISKDLLFVWTDWRDYIQMRKIILQNCHFPMAIKSENQLHHNPELYAKYLEDSIKNEETEDKAVSHVKRIKVLNNFIPILKNIAVDVRTKYNTENSGNEGISLIFNPSSTPHLDYFAEIKELNLKEIYIPKYMNVNHADRCIKYFLHPNNLNKYLIKNFDIKLDFQKIELNNNNWNNIFAPFVIKDKPRDNEYYKIDLIEDSTDDESYISEVHEQISYENLCGIKKILNPKKISVPLPVEINIPKVFSNQSGDDDDNDDDNKSVTKTTHKLENIQSLEHLSFDLPHFHYWILKSESNIQYLAKDLTNDLTNMLPRNFYWLLKTFATSVEMSDLALYHELLLVEKYFCTYMKPLSRIDNMLLFYKFTKSFEDLW